MWDLRNGWDTGDNNSSSLYGWREGGDYGLLGNGTNSPPSTGTYVPYPNYFAEQLASKIIKAGGKVVQDSSSDPNLSVYTVLEVVRTPRSAGHQQEPHGPDHGSVQLYQLQALGDRASLAIWRGSGHRPEPDARRLIGTRQLHDPPLRERIELQLFVSCVLHERHQPDSEIEPSGASGDNDEHSAIRDPRRCHFIGLTHQQRASDHPNLEPGTSSVLGSEDPDATRAYAFPDGRIPRERLASTRHRQERLGYFLVEQATGCQSAN